MNSNYMEFQMENRYAEQILYTLYGIIGSATKLYEDIDFNFKINTNTNETYLLKVSRGKFDNGYLDYQLQLLQYFQATNKKLNTPIAIPDRNGSPISSFIDDFANEHKVRLLTYLEGNSWVDVPEKNSNLYRKLGKQCALSIKALSGFDHIKAHRRFDLDILEGNWTRNHFSLFNKEEQTILVHFLEKFNGELENIQKLRKGIIHNNMHDGNILVENIEENPTIFSVVNYKNAIYSTSINELAVAIAYVLYGKNEILNIALPIIEGFHKKLLIQEDELKYLPTLISMRLIINLVKAKMSLEENPNDKELKQLIEAIWTPLKSLHQLNENFIVYSFRKQCNYPAHPNYYKFKKWAMKNSQGIENLFPSLNKTDYTFIDMSVDSNWDAKRYENKRVAKAELTKFKKKYPESIITGGYLEERCVYDTEAYKNENDNSYRSIHLGVDFWVKEDTPVHALYDGKVVILHNNSEDKDYGPTIVLEHKADRIFTFYTLYGHLTRDSLNFLKVGKRIKKGDVVGYIGHDNENGNWLPHLHFQIILDLLGNTTNFPGVAFKNERSTWKNICPNPMLLLKNKKTNTQMNLNLEF
ncbi:peptidoglycan DD-metalloendopeptidase family protein [Aureivirga sp. CE67]|uniref:peptidoglycan DD-metalloendopeptidase family protein n=1 Tax=Aureivirga sp. CE67 TaxID=1788983 RepID=UPI0018CA32C5|nr:peptidoglycan DD-metalloendopeptidase family protein [Aureivirga sp. CE67]